MNKNQLHTKTTSGDACACGTECACTTTKGCCTSECKKTLFKSGVTLFSAILISGSILAAADIICGGKISSTSIDADITSFVQKNPKVILDSVNAYYAEQRQVAEKQAPKQAPQQVKADQKLIDEIVGDKTNYSLGNEKGSFVIIEFFDYQCGWCKRTSAGISEAIASGKAPNVRWILMDTPIFGDASALISKYVLAAGKQGKFAQMHDAVAAAKGSLTEDKLIELGKSIKADTAKLKADANGAEIAKKLENNQKYAKELNINGVPMLIVNGYINPGALIGEKLESVIKESNKTK